jgi:hypothetical protein
LVVATKGRRGNSERVRHGELTSYEQRAISIFASYGVAIRLSHFLVLLSPFLSFSLSLSLSLSRFLPASVIGFEGIISNYNGIRIAYVIPAAYRIYGSPLYRSQLKSRSTHTLIPRVPRLREKKQCNKGPLKSSRNQRERERERERVKDAACTRVA